MAIISAYRQLGGIQIHEDNGDGTLLALFVEEGSEGWLEALAALPPDDLPAEPAVQTLPALQRAAVAAINRVSGEVRSRFITILPGQEMIYLAKEAEALRFVSEAPATLSGYPLIAAEVGFTAPTASELAQIWLNMSYLWRGIAAQIEGIRMASIYAIEAATDAEDIASILQAALSALSGL